LADECTGSSADSDVEKLWKDLAERSQRDLEDVKRTARRKELTGLAIGASVAILGSLISNTYSSYLTRRDENARQVAACEGTTINLSVALHAIKDAAGLASQNLLEKKQHVVVLPPIDEIMRSQDQAAELLDEASQRDTIHLEMSYRAIRDQLANDSDVVTSMGDTFELPANASGSTSSLMWTVPGWQGPFLGCGD
jgi:hypothetical protein